jgi:seryl-tRNA synthetase
MLDLARIRVAPAEVAAALAKRVAIDFTDLLARDAERRDLTSQADALKARRNRASASIAELKRSGADASAPIAETRALGDQIKQLDQRVAELEHRVTSELEVLPNIPDADVPAGGKEANRQLSQWGEPASATATGEDHVAIAERLGLIDYARGTKLAGNGFWVYRGKGAQLELALLNYFIARHVAAGFELLLVPHIVGRQCAYDAGQLPKFGDQDIYSVGDPGDEQILIPTAETALAALHRGEILEADSLPRRYCAVTPCYRREAGSYRSHDRGTIRGHQFNKVELFEYVAPDRSAAAFDELADAAQGLVKELGLPHRVSLLAAGDCSAAAAKTHDIEVWIPSMASFEEVSSASNTRDYQARRSATRMRGGGQRATEFVHTLNASGLATSRLLPALLENRLQADGSVEVPEALQPFTGFDRIA